MAVEGSHNVDQAVRQAATQAAAQAIEKLNETEQQQARNFDENDSQLNRLLEGDKDAKKDLLKQSVMLAQSEKKGKDGEIQKSIEGEAQKLASQMESTKDDVYLRQKTKQAEKAKDAAKAKEGDRAQKSQAENNPTRNGLREFARQYAGYLLSKQGNAQKKQMEDIKKQLLKSGITTKQVGEMEGRMGNMVRQTAVKELKKQFLNSAFEKGRLGKGISNQQLYHSLNSFMNDPRMTGTLAYSKGSFQEKLQSKEYKQFQDGINWKLHQEVKLFIYDESFAQLLRATTDPKEANKVVRELVNTAKSVNLPFDMNIIFSRLKKVIDHMGIEHFVPPEGELSTIDHKEGEGGQKRQQQEYKTPEDELEDDVRQLFMTKFLSPWYKSILGVGRQIKKTLSKHGAELSDDDLLRLQEEGRLLARSELLQDLKETYVEQSSLMSLEGPAYLLITRKRKQIIKRLLKMGSKPEKGLLSQMQHDSNRAMFTVLREELHQLAINQDGLEQKQLARKKDSLTKVLERIKAESKIAEGIAIKGFDRSNWAQGHIAEAA